MLPYTTTAYAPVLAASLLTSLQNAIMSILTGGTELGAHTVMKMAVNIMTFQATDADIITMALSVTSPIGFLLMAAHFLVGLMQDNIRDGGDSNFTNWVVRAGLGLIAADLVLSNMTPIASVILSMSGSMGQIMLDALNQTESTQTFTFSIGGLASILALVIAALISIFAWVAQIIASLVIVVICLSAKIEVMLRVSLTPIGVACLADSEQRREGMRYLKKLLASGLYCMVIVLALYVANMANIGSVISSATGSADSAGDLIADVLSTAETMILVQMAAPLAAVGSISVAKSMINEALGA